MGVTSDSSSCVEVGPNGRRLVVEGGNHVSCSHDEGGGPEEVRYDRDGRGGCHDLALVQDHLVCGRDHQASCPDHSLAYRDLVLEPCCLY